MLDGEKPVGNNQSVSYSPFILKIRCLYANLETDDDVSIENVDRFEVKRAVAVKSIQLP